RSAGRRTRGFSRTVRCRRANSRRSERAGVRSPTRPGRVRCDADLAGRRPHAIIAGRREPPVDRGDTTVPRLTGKRALMEQLVADGVRYIFGNPGTTEQGFIDVLQEYPQVEFMLALHEGVAVGMADAYARATRRPAFVEVHTGPGLGNALGMI